jgi:nucleoside-diphosphate-sugar epimerase
MARVVVAGGAGFIGSFVCDALVARGDAVVVVDNLITGRLANLASHEGRHTVEVVEQDIGRPLQIEGPVDLVMDLASPASPDDFARLPLEILAAGSIGTANLLELALAKQARFVLSSSSEVYGDPAVHPQVESYWGHVDPIGPRSCYDEAKRFSEALATAHARVNGIDVRVARIFNTYGPRMRLDDGRVVTSFLAQALSGRPLTIFGDGRQTRSFCFVEDEVAGLLALADHAGPLPGPVNLGNPQEVTIAELATEVLAVTGSSSSVVTAPLPAVRHGDPVRRRPDITRARTLLGWAPRVGLREGLEQTAEVVRRELAGRSG